ncbi:Crp/Fnr family transcriptional regulator [Ningiella sp. W23]|uniref:Crp/Fnr family transcriptional regulator n=1 Tax=Ningiella sp. W23 TaxID=3023715 RepID=UPI003756A9BC
MSDNTILLPQGVSPSLVQQVNVFADLPAKLVQEFAFSEWNVGDYINPQILTERFFIMLDGQLEIKQCNPESGREITLDMLFMGDCFDLMVLLDGQPHDVILSPLSKVKLISVALNSMRKWLWTYPKFNQQFMPYLAKKMREKERQASDLVLCDVTVRLSRIILDQVNKIRLYEGPQDHEHRYHLVNGFSDETLARMTGSVRQVVNKQLQYLKRKGIIDKKRNQLIIKDLEALRKEAQYTHSIVTNA